MSDIKICEECGADTEYRVEGSTEGFFCTQCDWALVTTRISEIAQDITKYKMYLLFADSKNKEQLKAVSEIANVNFLQAKKMFQEDRALIVEDEALSIDNARKLFDTLSIRYEIEPNFPY
ncbi:hypothetical protein [Pseudoteredinibacter isoporae]|uniref:hypothetical protein n=1 Tax=Pseudoteredinibacter isoporae TaxID=570281 RepID=UPI003101BDDD